MEKYLITIDGGTTNTRAFLWDKRGRVVLSSKSSIRIRDSVELGDKQRLHYSIKHLISTLLEKQQLSPKQIAAIYASGMITSNMGLIELPHLIAPVSLEDFSEHVVSRQIPQICSLPIHFIPGMKNMPDTAVSLTQLDTMDIMRGEETEALALLEHVNQKQNCLLVLPGSHTKFILVNAEGQLSSCLTTLSGELLSVLTNHTVLADAVEHKFADEKWNSEYLLAGFQTAHTTSFSRTAFLTRIVSQFLSKDIECCASFLLGTVLENDITAIKSSTALKVFPHTQVYIAGKEPFCSALLRLFAADGYFSNVQNISFPDWRPMSGYGALLIARKRGDFKFFTEAID